jgi:Entner-Doudoroff aldolase
VDPERFVPLLGRLRASAILRTQLARAVRPAMEAAVEGGFRVIEFTLNTPGALECIAEFAARDELIVGAGTVLSVDDARRAVDHGAEFLVSPVVDRDVVRAALDSGATPIPGCRTPTELLEAHRAGAPLQKLFPAPADGPGYVRACLGPLPFLRIVPTSGVDAENAAAYLSAGAHAVGFVGPLFVTEDLERRRFERIAARAREMLAAVAVGRPGPDE